jgi:hypothetical protein
MLLLDYKHETQGLHLSSLETTNQTIFRTLIWLRADAQGKANAVSKYDL